MSCLALCGSIEYLCYGCTAITKCNSYSAGTVFIRRNMKSTDVGFRRIKTVPTLNELRIKGFKMPIHQVLTILIFIYN